VPPTVSPPFDFGYKTATFTLGQARRAMPGLFNSALPQLGGAVRNVAGNVVPGALGAGAAYGTWHSAVPENASTAQKVEGALAAALAGYGAQGFGRLNTYRNIARKANMASVDDVAKGLLPSVGKHRADYVWKDLIKPKAVYLAGSMIPLGISHAQSASANMSQMTADAAAVSGKYRNLVEELDKPDSWWRKLTEGVGQAGTNLGATSDTLRAGTEQVVGDVTKGVDDISGTLAGTAQDLRKGVQDVSGTVAGAAEDIRKPLTDAATSIAGAAKSTDTLAAGLTPLKDLVAEVTTKDDAGNTALGNVSGLTAELRAALKKFTGDDKANAGAAPADNVKRKLQLLNFANKALDYSPYIVGGGLGAAGLYGLYRMLRGSGAKKKPAAAAKRKAKRNADEFGDE